MARRKRTLAPPPVVDERELQWRYSWLSRAFWATEPSGTPGVVQELPLAERVRRERVRLDATAAPLVDRLAALEEFIAAAGYREYSERFIAHLEQARARWGSR